MSTAKKKTGNDLNAIKPIEWVTTITLPVFFMVGKEDNLAQPFRVKALFDQYAGQDKQFFLVEGTHQSSRDQTVIKRAVSFAMRTFDEEKRRKAGTNPVEVTPNPFYDGHISRDPSKSSIPDLFENDPTIMTPSTNLNSQSSMEIPNTPKGGLGLNDDFNMKVDLQSNQSSVKPRPYSRGSARMTKLDPFVPEETQPLSLVKEHSPQARDPQQTSGPRERPAPASKISQLRRPDSGTLDSGL